MSDAACRHQSTVALSDQIAKNVLRIWIRERMTPVVVRYLSFRIRLGARGAGPRPGKDAAFQRYRLRLNDRHARVRVATATSVRCVLRKVHEGGESLPSPVDDGPNRNSRS